MFKTRDQFEDMAARCCEVEVKVEMWRGLIPFSTKLVSATGRQDPAADSVGGLQLFLASIVEHAYVTVRLVTIRPRVTLKSVASCASLK